MRMSDGSRIGWYLPVSRSLFPSQPASPRAPRKQDLDYTEILHMVGNVEEWVLLENGSYGACGGSYNSLLENLSVTERPPAVPLNDPNRVRTPRIGFRLVFLLDEAHELPEALRFLEDAQK